MNLTNSWLLPEGIEELLPRDAKRLEHMRKQMLDLYQSWGYEMVIPPLIEHLDSLLVGSANDLEASIFRLTDSATGRSLGVRADMTTQVARIDAHRLRTDAPARLCYLGPVLLTHSQELGGSRSPFQAGAELYGHAGIDADLEVLDVMLDSLKLCKLQDVYLDLGHVQIFRALAEQAGLNDQQEQAFFDALQRKAVVEIGEMLVSVADKKVASMLASLVQLNGGPSIIAEARAVLKGATGSVHQALDQLQTVCEVLASRRPDLPLHVDLAELRGYQYHTGMVFTAYIPGYGQSVARGGRYDGVGSVFGRTRPATGYSMDLLSILAITPAKHKPSHGIFAPAQHDPSLGEKIAELRRNGERVVRELPGQSGGADSVGCDRQLVNENSNWIIKEI